MQLGAFSAKTHTIELIQIYYISQTCDCSAALERVSTQQPFVKNQSKRLKAVWKSAGRRFPPSLH
jgi:hypothetical protein